MVSRDEHRAVILRHNGGDAERAGVYHYTSYDIPGRLLLSLRESAKFLLPGLVLVLIPGEILFYGLFFLVIVPYEIYVCLRLRVVSRAVTGACPSCGDDVRIELERDEYPVLWKYCPACGAALRIG